MHKVFMLGMCQSGSLSLAVAFYLQGMSCMGANKLALNRLLQGDNSVLFENIGHYDCVRDYPFNIAYSHFLTNNDTVVLTTRADDHQWFDKLLEYTHQDRSHAIVHAYWWGKSVLEECDRNLCIDRYHEHNERVRNCCKHVGCYIVEHCVDRDSNWATASNISGLPIPSYPFPNSENRVQLLHEEVRRSTLSYNPRPWIVWDHKEWKSA